METRGRCETRQNISGFYLDSVLHWMCFLLDPSTLAVTVLTSHTDACMRQYPGLCHYSVFRTIIRTFFPSFSQVCDLYRGATHILKCIISHVVVFTLTAAKGHCQSCATENVIVVISLTATRSHQCDLYARATYICFVFLHYAIMLFWLVRLILGEYII